MFNVKISLLYFLLIALSVVAVVVIVGDQKGKVVAQAEQSLQQLPGMFDVHKALREERLKDFATRLADSELRAHLRALLDFRKAFIEVDRLICSADSGVKCDMTNTVFSAERARIAEQEFGEQTFAPFVERLMGYVEKYHPEWNDKKREGFRARSREQLKECFGRGSTQCDWSFTYHTLQRVLPALKRESDRVGSLGQAPDLVLVFDAQGVGIANADNDAWSYRREYMDLVGRLSAFAKGLDAGDITPVYFDLKKFEETGEIEYLVAMVPIFGKDSRFAGAVLVGEAITGKLVKADKSLFAAEVTYILDDKPLASTMERSQYSFVLTSAKVHNRLKTHLVSNDDWLGVSIPYYSLSARSPKKGEEDAKADIPAFVNGVAYGARYQTLRVAMARKRTDSAGAFTTLQRYVPIFGGVLFVVGLILFFLLIRNHTKPFETIDQGVHEVINGNFDYQFPFDYKEELPSVMAQSLNLMIAVLLGKPLPEDEEEAAGSWDGASSLVSSPSNTLARDAAGLVIEQRPDGGEVPPDIMREPAETYYKRLYGSYRQRRTELGAGDDPITYVRFVEQLVKSERELKGKLSCKHVRFTVKDRDGQVVLTPIPVA